MKKKLDSIAYLVAAMILVLFSGCSHKVTEAGKRADALDVPNEPVYLGVPETSKELTVTPNLTVTEYQAKIEASDASEAAKMRGAAFADAIQNNWITGFEKPGDQMVHVSTFTEVDGYYYMTYYANTSNGAEDPTYQKARLVYCPVDKPENKVYLDLQEVGDTVGDKTVRGVYDTVLMRKDDRTLYLLWTANVDGVYYRLYRLFDMADKTLGEVRVNRLEVCGERADFSAKGMNALFAKYGIACRTTFSDIGLMQKITSRVEGGETYYYTGAYSGNMTFIVKTKDFFTWEYVAQPNFDSFTKWENAVYVIGDRTYYFVRQDDSSAYGILTYYDLVRKTWATPVLVADCQSRSDFIMHDGELYLVYAPINRNHIGILHIDQDNLADSNIILQAAMHESCFYPFVQYCDGKLHFSYTMARQKIQFSWFDADTFLTPKL